MLLNFAVTNYRSIKERQVFSMLAVDGLPHEESLIHSKDDISILPVAILFGANASGKSNILRAFGTMRQMVLNSVRLNPDDTLDEYEPFLLDEESRNNDTEFEAEFIVDTGYNVELHYRYGFSFSGKLISEEWLYRQKEDTNEIELFVRTGGKIQINEKEFPEGKGKEDTLNNNRLFLSLIAQLNGVQSKEIIFWFNRSTFATALKTKQYLTLTSNLFKEKGDTVEEAIEDFKLSYADMKTLYEEEGKEFQEATFEFLYDLPSFLQHYSHILSFAGLERLTGVNQAQLSQYVQGYRKPSTKTVEKIQNHLQAFGKELQQLQFA